jgi:hypothetical protein
MCKKCKQKICACPSPNITIININDHCEQKKPCPKPKPCPEKECFNSKGVDSVVLNSTGIPFYNTGRFFGWQVFTAAPPFATTIPASNLVINSGNRIAIFLPGASGSATSIGNTLQSLGVYQQVLLMQYDVLETAPNAATFVASQFAPLLTLKSISIDIFAYSKGTLVSRYYFETLGYGSNCFFKNIMLIANAQEGYKFNSSQISDPLAAVASDLYNNAFFGITVAQQIFGNSITIAQRLAAVASAASYTNKWVDSKFPGVDPITTGLNLTPVSPQIKNTLNYLTANGYVDRGIQTTAQLTAWLNLAGVPVSATIAFNGTIAGTALTVNSGGPPVIGQLITGPGVVPGTVILSGVSPNFVVSVSQSVGPIAMTGVGPVFGNDHPYGWVAQNLINNPTGITDLLLLSYILAWESEMNNLAAVYDYVANKFVQLPNSVINENTVQTVAVVTGGNYSVPPTTVTFTPPPLPNGVTATGTVVTDFGVNQVTIVSGGSGYNLINPPQIVVNNSGTLGTNAAFAVSTVNPVTGAITGIQTVNTGIGYDSGPAPTLSVVGGTGSGAVLTCTIGPVLIGVNMTNNGSGYVQTAGATISGGTLLSGGSAATVTVVPLMQNIMDGFVSSSALGYQDPLTEKSNFYREHPYPARSMLPYAHTTIAGSSNTALGAATQMDPYLTGYYATMVNAWFKK